VIRTPPPFGMVIQQGPDGFAWRHGKLRVIASWGAGWEHASMSLETRCPTWDDMSWLAKLFFPNEYAMQLHVPESQHVNCHPYCLHLWRPLDTQIPTPPSWMVGPKSGGGQ